jgi:hypothetical protein
MAMTLDWNGAIGHPRADPRKGHVPKAVFGIIEQ